VTREHADIDIAVWLRDRTRLAAFLSDTGWSHTPDVGEDGYTCYQRRDVRLEIAFLAQDANEHIYTSLEAGRGEWPQDSFGPAVAQLDGVQACLVNRESLVIDKSVARQDPETSAKDRADVANLLDRTTR